ncbi:MAG: hypothetical protein EOP85_20845, partial [Verrucomicrobiaceae bacterium]
TVTVTGDNWQRVFDFGRMQSGFGSGLGSSARGTGASSGEIQPNATTAPNNVASSDDLALAIHRDSNANTHRIMARLNGAGELGNSTTGNLAVGTQYHFVCTFTDGAGASGSNGGQVAWYLNGALVSTLDVNFRLSSIEDVNNWLGRSMYTVDNNANIAYNEVRLYNHALTPAEMLANLAAGPDELVEPDPVDPPVPDNLWKFTTQADSEADSGTTFVDSIGNKVVTLRGNGGMMVMFSACTAKPD